jgi:DNA-directed RNA polymerase specialized sigma24 family protein
MIAATRNQLVDRRRRDARLVPDDGQVAEVEDSEANTPAAVMEAVERAKLCELLLKTLKGEKLDGKEDRLMLLFAQVQQELHKRLTPKQWILLRMRGIYGLGFEECARAQQASLGSVHKWYTDALQICSSVLSARGVSVGAG